METFHAFILAIVQGLTEFLPVSSSAHLILVPRFLGWPDQGVAFDVFISLGTLAAVISYFYLDLAAIFYHWCMQFRKNRPEDPQHYARLGNLLILATLPAVAVGFFLAERRGNEALIQIINTLPPASAGHQSTGHGMALDNVRARLSLLHDLQGSFSAKVRDGLYVVRLSVPLQQTAPKPGESRHAHSDR